jgi:ADP-ribose pyrophosphatase YjhB (NUDIX family)
MLIGQHLLDPEKKEKLAKRLIKTFRLPSMDYVNVLFYIALHSPTYLNEICKDSKKEFGKSMGSGKLDYILPILEDMGFIKKGKSEKKIEKGKEVGHGRYPIFFTTSGKCWLLNMINPKSALEASKVFTHDGDTVVTALLEKKSEDIPEVLSVLGDEDHPYTDEWCLPGGLANIGVQPIDELKRRAKKTLGIELKVGEIVYDSISEGSLVKYALPYRVIVYKCKILSGKPHVVDKNVSGMVGPDIVQLKREIKDVKYWSVDELLKLENVVGSVKEFLYQYYYTYIK